MIIFDGMQPLLRHVPPIGPFSTTATFRPFSAAAEEMFNPEPAPITIKSKVCIFIFYCKNYLNMSNLYFPYLQNLNILPRIYIRNQKGFVSFGQEFL